MTCDEAIQLLPWLLNGTLEEGERREVRRHLEICESCREALTGTWEAGTIFGQHLPSEALVALAYGEPPAGIDPALAERHLASCPECATELELARMSRRLEEDPKLAVFTVAKPKPANANGRGERAWRGIAMAASLAGLLVAGGGWLQSSWEVRRLSTELAEKPAPAPAPAERPAPATPPVSGGDSGAQARIAEMEAAFNREVEARKELERQEKEMATQIAALERIQEPELNAWTDTLILESDVVRGAGDEMVIPAGVRVTPILPAEKKGETSPTREIEILDATGKKVWAGSGLKRNPETNDYTFSLRAGFLKPGRYTIQLYNAGEKRETYKIRVEP